MTKSPRQDPCYDFEDSRYSPCYPSCKICPQHQTEVRRWSRKQLLVTTDHVTDYLVADAVLLLSLKAIYISPTSTTPLRRWHHQLGQWQTDALRPLPPYITLSWLLNTTAATMSTTRLKIYFLVFMVLISWTFLVQSYILQYVFYVNFFIADRLSKAAI